MASRAIFALCKSVIHGRVGIGDLKYVDMRPNLSKTDLAKQHLTPRFARFVTLLVYAVFRAVRSLLQRLIAGVSA